MIEIYDSRVRALITRRARSGRLTPDAKPSLVSLLDQRRYLVVDMTKRVVCRVLALHAGSATVLPPTRGQLERGIYVLSPNAPHYFLHTAQDLASPHVSRNRARGRHHSSSQRLYAAAAIYCRNIGTFALLHCRPCDCEGDEHRKSSSLPPLVKSLACRIEPSR